YHIGVHPDDLARYSGPGKGHRGSGNGFICAKTGKRIPWSAVNDDYCDCEEGGEDEPGRVALWKEGNAGDEAEKRNLG
ncbi:hypothetical protein HK101_006163, partial [Irineochytrium annulatum]